MTPEQIEAILVDSREEIRAAAVAALKKHIAETVGWRMSEHVDAAVAEFIKTEVAPEVVRMLADEKAGILAQLEPAVAAIGVELAKAVQKTAAENLTGYRGAELIRGLFGGR